MSRNIDVDHVDLHLAAGSIRGHADDLRSAHSSSESSTQAAQTGWVGESAGALATLLPRWTEFSRSIDSRLNALSAHFDASAVAYKSTDTENASSVKNATAAKSRLNLAD